MGDELDRDRHAGERRAAMMPSTLLKLAVTFGTLACTSLAASARADATPANAGLRDGAHDLDFDLRNRSTANPS